MAYLSPLSNLINTAVRKAANSLIRDFGEIEKLQSSVKGYKEFVVSAYERINFSMKKELSKARPDIVFYEEGKPVPSTPHFIMSALDGLDNFAHGIAHFAISLAISDGKETVYGLVYNPIADELFYAEKGKGAYKDGSRSAERLRVSVRKDMKDSIVSGHEKFCKNFANIRHFGTSSLDLAFVASGKLDAVIVDEGVNTVAGKLMVKEAGGHIYELKGEVLAVNSELNKKVYDLVK